MTEEGLNPNMCQKLYSVDASKDVSTYYQAKGGKVGSIFSLQPERFFSFSISLWSFFPVYELVFLVSISDWANSQRPALSYPRTSLKQDMMKPWETHRYFIY